MVDRASLCLRGAQRPSGFVLPGTWRKRRNESEAERKSGGALCSQKPGAARASALPQGCSRRSSSGRDRLPGLAAISCDASIRRARSTIRLQETPSRPEELAALARSVPLLGNRRVHCPASRRSIQIDTHRLRADEGESQGFPKCMRSRARAAPGRPSVARASEGEPRLEALWRGPGFCSAWCCPG